jgi:hypothetical protein
MGTIITHDDIAAEAAKWPIERLWRNMYRHTLVLEPFWRTTTQVFAERVSLPPEKLQKHLKVIDGAFAYIEQWRRKNVKYVKARFNELESALSFVFQKAYDKNVSGLEIAPIAQNAIGAIRGTSRCATPGSYSDDQLPELFAGLLYELAMVRAKFPFIPGDLMHFHPGWDNIPAGADWRVVTFQIAAREIGIESELDAVFAEVEKMWRNVDEPEPLDLAKFSWDAEGTGHSAMLHFAAQRAFHRRP